MCTKGSLHHPSHAGERGAVPKEVILIIKGQDELDDVAEAQPFGESVDQKRDQQTWLHLLTPFTPIRKLDRLHRSDGTSVGCCFLGGCLTVPSYAKARIDARRSVERNAVLCVSST